MRRAQKTRRSSGVGALNQTKSTAITVAGSPPASATSASSFWNGIFIGWPSASDPELLQPSIHRAPAQSQGLRRCIHTTAVTAQGGPDQQLLGILQAHRLDG